MNIVQFLKEKYNLSIYLDYIDNEIMESLAQWVKERKIYGITTNPNIFSVAISKNPSYYLGKVKNISKRDIFSLIEDIMIEEVKKACDIMIKLFEDTQDGLVSIELPPYIAYDKQKTIEKAKEIWQKVNMPNLMIKIPATNEGIEAIGELFKENININITLLFSIERYKKVIKSYKESKTFPISVASFFVSRLDTVIDQILTKFKEKQVIDEKTYNKLIGNTAISYSLLAYKIYKNEFFENANFQDINIKNVQRILWASTSTKNPSYHPLKYVLNLLTPNSINTLPLNTYKILLDTDIETIEKYFVSNIEEDHFQIISSLKEYINLDFILEELLYKGVSLFSDAYNSIFYEILDKIYSLSMEGRKEEY